jgi:hypothetical protein
MEKEIVVKIVENAYNKIKRDNPYRNLKFVTDLIDDKIIAESVKKIILSKDKNAPKLVLDFLFENNYASKYVEIADYMNYPLVTEGLDMYMEDDMGDELIDDIDMKIKKLIADADFPYEWYITSQGHTDVDSDYQYVKIQGEGGLNFTVLPQNNGNYTLMVGGQKNKENIDFKTLSDELISRIERRHQSVNHV